PGGDGARGGERDEVRRPAGRDEIEEQARDGQAGRGHRDAGARVPQQHIDRIACGQPVTGDRVQDAGGDGGRGQQRGVPVHGAGSEAAGTRFAVSIASSSALPSAPPAANFVVRPLSTGTPTRWALRYSAR